MVKNLLIVKRAMVYTIVFIIEHILKTKVIQKIEKFYAVKNKICKNQPKHNAVVAIFNIVFSGFIYTF